MIALLTAGVAVFPNSITGTDTTTSTAAYHGISVAGASLTDAVCTFDTAGANITGVSLTFANDLTGDGWVRTRNDEPS